MQAGNNQQEDMPTTLTGAAAVAAFLAKPKVAAKLNKTSDEREFTWEDKALAAKAKQLIAAKVKAKEIEAEIELLEAEIKPKARAKYFEANAGVPEPYQRLRLGETLILFSEVYAKKEEPKLAESLPAEVIDTLTDLEVQIAVDANKVPNDKAGEFVEGLLKLASKCDCESAVKVSTVRSLTNGFNTARHTALTPEQNLALENQGLSTRITIKQ